MSFRRVSCPCTLAEFSVGVGWEFIWYLGDWWWMKAVEWSPRPESDNFLGPYRLLFTLVNLNHHSKNFEFEYDPKIEPYCDGNRKGYRIMPPANHSSCPCVNCPDHNTSDRRFWIVLSRNQLQHTLSIHNSTEHKTEAAAIAAAEAHAKAAPHLTEFFVMESVSRTAQVSIITERLRHC